MAPTSYSIFKNDSLHSLPAGKYTRIDLKMNDEFRSLISQVLNIPPEQIRDDMTPETLKSWDSLATVNLVVGIEDRYKLVLDLDELMKLTSVGGIRHLLNSKGIAV